MRQYVIKNFNRGIIDRLEQQSIPPESASKSLDFLTNGDRIELRRGYKLLGTEITGLGAITGLHVAQKANGTEVLYETYAQN